MKPLRWGIVGLGNIAHQFIQDLQLLPNTEVVAVGSRSPTKAQAFAQQYQVAHAFGDYFSVFKHPEVDVVYVATPHDTHEHLSISAMNAGKHVLCEKPLGINYAQVQNMIAAARKNSVFLMEAYWTRFNPTFRKCLQLIEENLIGAVNYVNADFSFYGEGSPESRMYNMELAGGSLLDLGIYPIGLAYCIFGMPEQIVAAARFHETGADLQTMAILKFKNGMANIMTGFSAPSDLRAKIYGTGGQLFIDAPWYAAQGYTVDINGELNTYLLPTNGRGFTYEIEACMECIAQKKMENDLWTHQNSLDIAFITDEIRRQTGLSYPME